MMYALRLDIDSTGAIHLSLENPQDVGCERHLIDEAISDIEEGLREIRVEKCGQRCSEEGLRIALYPKEPRSNEDD